MPNEEKMLTILLKSANKSESEIDITSLQQYIEMQFRQISIEFLVLNRGGGDILAIGFWTRLIRGKYEATTRQIQGKQLSRIAASQC